MIKLCKFCGSEPLHHQPIWDYYSGKTYVTNGYYILRVSGRIDGAAEAKAAHQQMLTCAESAFPAASERAAMRHVPHSIDRVTVTRCEKCRGFGITKECPHCDGEGELAFVKDHLTYECECQVCFGDCVVHAHRQEEGAERCSCCQGFGREVDERYFAQPERIGKARLSPDQMLRLSHLPLIAWAAHGIHGHFIFFGGDGVLLGQKTQED